jgi:molybdenum cofactor cytidylyltransferase
MNLFHALRLNTALPFNPVISIAGAGGKSTALFQLAKEYLAAKDKKVFVSTTTHLGAWQASNADHHVIAKDVELLNRAIDGLQGSILITGPIKEDRLQPLGFDTLYWLYEKSRGEEVPLLIEADGARAHSLKTPDEHEPPIPEFTDTIIYLTGLSVIGKPLTSEHVHRPEIFSKLSGLPLHQIITPESVTTMLRHPNGGLKNTSPSMRQIVFLNQADSPTLQSIGGAMAYSLLNEFDSVLVGSLKQETFQTIEHTAGIILAAGQSTRYGSPKQLLDWHGKPFVRHIAETALQSGLDPVIVVTGPHHTEIEVSLADLPIKVVQNTNYSQGQSSSIKAGLQAVPDKNGACIFLLADQPQIPPEVIRALTEAHSRELSPIIAPLVLEERRANPVLFDKITFPDLLKLEGDTGGRAIFSKYRVEYLPWHDDRLLFDVDKPEDYQRLVTDDTL